MLMRFMGSGSELFPADSVVVDSTGGGSGHSGSASCSSATVSLTAN